jgi:transcriptional regulator with XRE-family HTH domain
MSHRHRTLIRFGLNVRRRSEAAGPSQEVLAEKADLDRTYISSIAYEQKISDQYR